MARRRKRKAEPRPDPTPATSDGPIGTGLGALLTQAGVGQRPPEPAAPAAPAAVEAAPAPDSPAPAADRTALNAAYAGIEPIRRPKRGRSASAAGRAAPQPDPERLARDASARARLAALVGGAVDFRLEHDGEGAVSGLRQGVPEAALRRLASPRFVPEAQLDLHGMQAAQVATAVDRWVRQQQRSGRRYLLLIVGKGHHSEGGVGVLGDAAVDVLSRGGAAPRVRAFHSAAPQLGGVGALSIELD